MTTVHKNSNNEVIAFTKGALDRVIGNCTKIFINGN